MAEKPKQGGVLIHQRIANWSVVTLVLLILFDGSGRGSIYSVEFHGADIADHDRLLVEKVSGTLAKKVRARRHSVFYPPPIGDGGRI